MNQQGIIMVEVDEKRKKLVQAALKAIDNAYVLWGLEFVRQCLQRTDRFMRDVMLRVGFLDLESALRETQSIMPFCMVIGKLMK